MNKPERPNLKQQCCDAIDRMKVRRTADSECPVRITGLAEVPIDLSDAEAQMLAEMLANSDPEYERHRDRRSAALPYWMFKARKIEFQKLLAEEGNKAETLQNIDLRIKKFDHLRRSLGY